MKWLLIAMFIETSGAAVTLGKLQVVTSLPDLAYAVRQIGDNKVEVASLLNGTQNPHYADAVPEFIRKVANADVVCVAGLALEVGWMPKVLEKSANAEVQYGGKGYCEVGRRVAVLSKINSPSDRSQGDVHPQGNPHFWLDPLALAAGAEEILEAMSRVAPTNAAYFAANYLKFCDKMQHLHDEGLRRLTEAFNGKPATTFIQYHTNFVYLFNTYGLTSIGSIEEKPGVPPSAGRLALIAIKAKKSGVVLAIATEYDPRATLEKFREVSGIPTLQIPDQIHTQSGHTDYEKLQRYFVDHFVKYIKGEK